VPESEAITSMILSQVRCLIAYGERVISQLPRRPAQPTTALVIETGLRSRRVNRPYYLERGGGFSRARDVCWVAFAVREPLQDGPDGRPPVAAAARHGVPAQLHSGIAEWTYRDATARGVIPGQ
jgi:hypothetical protein